MFHIRHGLSSENEREKVQEKEDPIFSVYINRERQFAFVELRSVDICTACLQFDWIDILLKGKVKVKRPNDYDPASAANDSLNGNNINNNATAGSMGDGSILVFDVSRLGVVSATVADGSNDNKEKEMLKSMRSNLHNEDVTFK